MNKILKTHIENLGTTDDKTRLEALQTLLGVTESKVDWIYEVWDLLLEKLDHENSYQRSIAVMLLCNLAKSDVDNRLQTVLDRLFAHTKDEKFITSRQCLQNLWKVAAANKRNREKVLKHLDRRFRECTQEKHYNLLRLDILQSLLCLYQQEKDDRLVTTVQALIAQEKELKYRKQYEALLKSR